MPAEGLHSCDRAPVSGVGRQQVNVAGQGARGLCGRRIQLVGIDRLRRPCIALRRPHRRGCAVQAQQRRGECGNKCGFADPQMSSGFRRRSTRPAHAASMIGSPGPASNSQSACMGGLLQQVAHHGGFGPVNVVAALGAEVGAVAAVRRFHQGHVGIGEDGGARLRREYGQKGRRAHGG